MQRHQLTLLHSFLIWPWSPVRTSSAWSFTIAWASSTLNKVPLAANSWTNPIVVGSRPRTWSNTRIPLWFRIWTKKELSTTFELSGFWSRKAKLSVVVPFGHTGIRSRRRLGSMFGSNRGVFGYKRSWKNTQCAIPTVWQPVRFEQNMWVAWLSIPYLSFNHL